METGLGNSIIEMIVLIELALIILMVFSTYLAKLSVMIVARRRQKLIATIEQYFTQLIKSRAPLNLQQFKNRWKKIQFLFPIFMKFDKEYSKDAAWTTIRSDFLNGILVPLARKRARARRWILRFYSSETFALAYAPQDEFLLLRLLKDRIPLVYLHAIKTAVKSNSEAAINAVITRMAKMSWLTQTMYLKPFEEASPHIVTYIEKRLLSAKESEIRAECYKLLRKFKIDKITWDMKDDLNSSNFELRLSAVKFLIHVDETAAIPVLLNKLKDEHWEMRVVAIHRLTKLKTESALLAIADCLADTDWRVKMSAAESLKSFGSKGDAILREREPMLANIAVTGENHLPGTAW